MALSTSAARSTRTVRGRTSERTERSSRPVAVITGAESPDGIGFACAHRLAEDHAVVIASTTERIHDRAEQLGGERSGAVGFVGDRS